MEKPSLTEKSWRLLIGRGESPDELEKGLTAQKRGSQPKEVLKKRKKSARGSFKRDPSIRTSSTHAEEAGAAGQKRSYLQISIRRLARNTGIIQGGSEARQDDPMGTQKNTGNILILCRRRRGFIRWVLGEGHIKHPEKKKLRR